MLSDLERRISLNVGHYLVLSEEGNPTQIAFAQYQAQSEYNKFGPEMHKIAAHIGGDLPECVQDFLDSVNSILYISSDWMGEELISNCLDSTQRLITELKIT